MHPAPGTGSVCCCPFMPVPILVASNACNNIHKRRAGVRALAPATAHQFSEPVRTTDGNRRSKTVICDLMRSMERLHVRERPFGCRELPADDAIAVDICLFCVRALAEHLRRRPLRRPDGAERVAPLLVRRQTRARIFFLISRSRPTSNAERLRQVEGT